MHLPPPEPAELQGLPLDPRGPSTLLAALCTPAGEAEPWLTTGPATALRIWSRAELHAQARRWRRALVGVGVRPGDRVALWLPNDERFVAAFFGAHLAGAAAVPLSWPVSLVDGARKVDALRPLFDVAAVSAVVTDAMFDTAALGAAAGAPVLTEPAASGAGGDVDPAAEAVALVQFTSGSLGRPRGAEITQRALTTCVRSMVQAMSLGPADRGVSWLPLFHDMGLVGGLLCPLWAGFPLHLMTPGEFLLHPERWVRRFAEVGGTVAAAPDFAWRLASRRVRSVGGSLSAWRIGLDGAEPVHRGTLDGFQARFAPDGLPAGVVRPAYGLAENTLAVAIYDPARPAEDHVGHLRRVPSCGAPVPGVEVRVTGEGGVVGVGEEGAIEVRSGSLMRGYFRDEAETAAALVGGWLRTGDLGVVSGGQLYVTGRAKELLIQNGSKFHPYDLERAAADAVDAAMAGAAAFSVPGEEGERLVLAVEVPPAFDGDPVRRVRAAVLDALGVRLDVVLPVAPGSLPRTTSGKVRRRDAAVALAEHVHG